VIGQSIEKWKRTLKIIENNKQIMKEYAEAFNHDTIEKFINE
jgi:hypothetical protein